MQMNWERRESQYKGAIKPATTWCSVLQDHLLRDCEWQVVRSSFQGKEELMGESAVSVVGQKLTSRCFSELLEYACVGSVEFPISVSTRSPGQEPRNTWWR